MTDAATGPVFDLDAWQAYAATPWARIRYAVVRETLSRWSRAEPMHVLDVGGGDGRDSLPLAMAGHDVEVLDPDPTMLTAARESAAAAGVPVTATHGGLDDLSDRSADLVLCHFVLPYRPDPQRDLVALAGAVAPGGMLSLICHNPAGRHLFTLVRQGPAAALAELDSAGRRSADFDHEMRWIDAENAAATLAAEGLEVVGRYGGRIANDLLTDNEPKHDPAYYADLERLEIALCDREPYLRIGAFWQLVARKPAWAVSLGT